MAIDLARHLRPACAGMVANRASSICEAPFVTSHSRTNPSWLHVAAIVPATEKLTAGVIATPAVLAGKLDNVRGATGIVRVATALDRARHFMRGAD